MPLIVAEDGLKSVRRARLEDYVEAIKALLMLVPTGCVTTYGALARLLGISPRLVGRALSLNDEPVVVPCHRVVKSSGDLGGYTPWGVEFKRALLRVEGALEDGELKCVIDDII